MQDAVSQPSVDVLVIGGGPAGSTVSALLAKQEFKVALLEKERHPRFHIGESLLPMSLPIFKRLGVQTQIEAIGMMKYGAHFVSDTDPNRDQTFYFAEALDKAHPCAFEVRRAEFDHLLLQNSITQGVAVHEGVEVTAVAFEADGVRVTARDERGQTQYWWAHQLVDASGRETFLARHLSTKVKNPRHASAAIFGHFADVERLPGHDAGNISVLWFAHGWFWMIPLKDGAMSVGAVCWPDYLKTRKTSPETFLWETIKLCPGVYRRMQHARLIGSARATGNYSYRSTRLYGDRYVLVGDAYTFIDPVFSSGVNLAMQGAVLAAEVVAARLTDPRRGERLARAYERRLQRAIDTISWFIYRFTSPAMRRLFMAPRNALRMQEAIISVLAGDLFGRTPLRLPITLFKGVYYATSLALIGHTYWAWRYRQRTVRTVFTGGTTPQDGAA